MPPSDKKSAERRFLNKTARKLSLIKLHETLSQGKRLFGIVSCDNICKMGYRYTSAMRRENCVKYNTSTFLIGTKFPKKYEATLINPASCKHRNRYDTIWGGILSQRRRSWDWGKAAELAFNLPLQPQERQLYTDAIEFQLLTYMITPTRTIYLYKNHCLSMRQNGCVCVTTTCEHDNVLTQRSNLFAETIFVDIKIRQFL